MYCPLCGKELKEIERSEKSRRINNNDWDYDSSDWYYCPENHCFGKDYPLVHHGAPGIYRSQDGVEPNIMNLKPGDSWSLTWLK